MVYAIKAELKSSQEQFDRLVEDGFFVQDA
jgi:hypothetical protein